MIGKHDVLVVGAGCAGMRAAIAAHDAGADVAMISKLHPTRSHSGAAEGGINAALGNAADDSPEIHAYDTVKGSDYLGDQDSIELFTAEAPGDIIQLENWGAVFSRREDGKLAQRPFGAAGSPRTVFAADITGHVLIQVLYEQVCKRDIKVYEEFFAWQLVVNDDRCQGVICWDLLNGGLNTLGGKTIVLATGGAGRQYRVTTNAYACTGDGMAMALHAGVPLKDMEFMQFHPTTLYPSGILLTEGCRGEGAYLINKDGERFMKNYAPNALELASRDVVSRSEQTEIDAGRGINGSVMLDMRHLGADRIIDRLPGSRELSMTFAGVDPIFDPVPVRPGAHYHMGGVETNSDGATELTGLYAAGECACVSVHGSNRLGGNSLMETITFGRRAGTAAAEWALANTTIDVPESAERDAEQKLKTLRRPDVRRAAVEDPRGARRVHAGELRGLPPRGADGAPGRDPRRAARALQERLRRGQGHGLQQRPDAGDRAREHARHRALHGHRRSRPQGEPRRPLAAVRLSGPRRRELPPSLDRLLARRRPGAVDEAGAVHEVGARGAQVLMGSRRAAVVLLLLVLPLGAAACGGGKKSSSTTTTSASSPLDAVRAAAEKTVKAGTMQLALSAAATGSTTVAVAGAGGFDTANHTGKLHLHFSTSGISSTLDVVLSGTDLYVSSPLFSLTLPAGKSWIKLDLTKRRECRRRRPLVAAVAGPVAGARRAARARAAWSRSAP